MIVDVEIAELTRVGPLAWRPTISAEFLTTVTDCPFVSVAVTAMSYIPDTRYPELEPPPKFTEEDPVHVPSKAVPADLLKLNVPLDNPVSPTE